MDRILDRGRAMRFGLLFGLVLSAACDGTAPTEVSGPAAGGLPVTGLEIEAAWAET